MIRKAAAADVDSAARIYEHILEWEQQGRMSTGWLPDVYPVRATAQAAFDRGDLFVYEKDGTVLASAVINQIQMESYSEINWKYDAQDSEVMVLHTLSVEPAAIKNGIGTDFVRFYEKYAENAGCKVLRMDTNAKNRAARAFYKKLGFIESGIVPCVFNGIPDVQLVLLEKRLDCGGD